MDFQRENTPATGISEACEQFRRKFANTLILCFYYVSNIEFHVLKDRTKIPKKEERERETEIEIEGERER